MKSDKEDGITLQTLPDVNPGAAKHTLPCNLGIGVETAQFQMNYTWGHVLAHLSS